MKAAFYKWFWWEKLSITTIGLYIHPIYCYDRNHIILMVHLVNRFKKLYQWIVYFLIANLLKLIYICVVLIKDGLK